MALLKIKPFIIDDITTSNVIEGANLYYTNARVYANVIGLIPDVALKANVADLNTSNVVEGANLYYTNARVYANVIGLIPDITGKANTADLNTSNVVEGANLYFTNTRAISAFTAGQNIVIASNGLILSTASGGGGNYDNTNAYANLLVALPNYSGNLQVGNANLLGTLTLTGNIVTSISGNGYLTGANLISTTYLRSNVWEQLYTSNVIEGSNLYYTNARVYANVIGLIPNVALKANVADLNTSNVLEGSNLYYTNARVYANVIGLIPNVALKANVADLNTSNVLEGSNLYFTNTRAVSALTAGQNIVIASNGLILSTASGGGGGNYDNTNAYANVIVLLPNYTGNLQAGNANVTGTILAGNIISGTGAGGAITGANLLQTTYISANVWEKLYAANVIESGNTLTGNVFFTNARAVGALTAGQNIVIASNGLILSTASGGGGNYDNTNAYANLLVALPNYSGNLQAGNANVTGTIFAGNIIFATGVGDGSALTNLKPNIHMTVALSDETTSITTGVSKITFRAPYAMTLTQIPRASLSTASTSGNPTVDIDKNGVSIFSTLLSIDANEKTSTTAATPAVLSTTTFADDDEITMDITTAGTDAKGLKVTLYYRRT